MGLARRALVRHWFAVGLPPWETYDTYDLRRLISRLTLVIPREIPARGPVQKVKIKRLRSTRKRKGRPLIPCGRLNSGGTLQRYRSRCIFTPQPHRSVGSTCLIRAYQNLCVEGKLCFFLRSLLPCAYAIPTSLG